MTTTTSLPTVTADAFTADSARHHPIAAVCAALGVPPRDWRLFRRWIDETLNLESVGRSYMPTST